jgi:hypothetical protein
MKIRKMVKVTATLLLLFISLSFSYAAAQGFTNLGDCLVTNDIGKFTYKLRNAQLGNAAGVVGGAGHFKLDHQDAICNGSYSNISEIRGLPLEEAEEKSMSVKVEVTQHTGGDSDRWLLHEIEDNYHDDEMETLGLVTDGAVMRKIDNKRVLWLGIGGGTFRWVSNNVVINVSYTDLQGNKPEPLDVVQAYLTKFPSTITNTDAEFKSTAYNVKWIKDEIDRRLWLCDKWNAQFQAGGVAQADLIYNLVRSMKVFLNYRQKYFDVKAEADLKLLFGYQQNKDIAAIQTKLSEYKGWWSKNKAKSFSFKSRLAMSRQK